VFAKDPHRRKSRSGSRRRPQDPRSASSPTQDSLRRVSSRFLLYVEGARDREILGCWARRVDPGLTRCIEANTVILGGRRPARAVADFEKRGGVSAGYSGIVVLDRDDHGHEVGVADPLPDAGLELFVWSLRHIESYLLVPAAIRRMLGLAADDRTVERFIENDAPDDQPPAPPGSTLHAKRILGAGGLLSEALGAELRAGEIARAMRIDELHTDVHTLLDRIGTLSGHSKQGPEVVIRSSGSPKRSTDA
jgi:hypothetical protein